MSRIAHVQIENRGGSPLNLKKTTSGGISQVWSGVPSQVQPGQTSELMRLSTNVGVMERGTLEYYVQGNDNVLSLSLADRPNNNDVSVSGDGIACAFVTKIGEGGSWSAPGHVVEGSDLYVKYIVG